MPSHAITARRSFPRSTLAALATLAMLLALLPLVTACVASDRVVGPGAPRMEETVVTGTPTGIARVLLEHASAGLTYTSESDYPFTWYFRAGPIPEPLAVDAFRAALGIAATVPVETREVDEFFARHIEWVDPYDATAVALVPRYEQLRATVKQVLRDPRVFRVGRIAIDCYIVGFDRAGNLVGLTTVAIET